MGVGVEQAGQGSTAGSGIGSGQGDQVSRGICPLSWEELGEEGFLLKYMLWGTLVLGREGCMGRRKGLKPMILLYFQD